MSDSLDTPTWDWGVGSAGPTPATAEIHSAASQAHSLAQAGEMEVLAGPACTPTSTASQPVVILS